MDHGSFEKLNVTDKDRSNIKTIKPWWIQIARRMLIHNNVKGKWKKLTITICFIWLQNELGDMWMMEIMDHDRFKRWIECQQGLKWSTMSTMSTHRRTREQDENGQSYWFTHQGVFHSFGQCIHPLGFRAKASFETASKLFNQHWALEH